MELRSLIGRELVFPGIDAPDRRSALSAIAHRLAKAGAVVDADRLLEKLIEREELGSTALGSGVAIPHCKLAGIPEVFVSVATIPDGVEFAAPDSRPVRLMFVVISPEAAPAAHLRSLAAISTWIKETGSLEDVFQEKDASEIYRLLVGGSEEPEASAPAATSEKVEDSRIP